jgi:nucleoside-diphosphate-sugar epimerase
MIRHHLSTPAIPSRVVVLGASGFVGGDLVAHLREQRIPVLGLSSREIDLLQPSSVEQLHQSVCPDDVLVLTSTIMPDKGKEIRTLMQNLTMGQHISAFLEQSACSHIVYLSSDAVYDHMANPVRAISPCNPTNLHGIMHLARERMLTHAALKSQTPLLVVRSTGVYGATDTHDGYGPNRFVRTALKEQAIRLFGAGEEKRDHLYVRDLCRLIGLGILHRSDGVVNAASGQSASFREVAGIITECCPGVRLECLPCRTPNTHRHFDVAATLRAFPTMQFTPLRVGLMAMTTALAPKAEMTLRLAA